MPKYSKNRGVFWHVTNNEMEFTGIISGDMSYLFSGNLNPLFKRNEEISSCFTQQNTLEFLEYFGSLVHPFPRPSFLTTRRP